MTPWDRTGLLLRRAIGNAAQAEVSGIGLVPGGVLVPRSSVKDDLFELTGGCPASTDAREATCLPGTVTGTRRSSRQDD